MLYWNTLSLTIHIVIVDAIFDVAGDTPFAEVRTLADQWFAAIATPNNIEAMTQAVDSLTAKAQALQAAQQATS